MPGMTVPLVDAGAIAPEAHLAGRVGRGALWSSVNNILLRFAAMAVNIALARILAPSQFGAFAVAVTVYGILSAAADLGIAADLVRHGDFARRAATTATLGAASGGALMLAMILTARPIASAMGAPDAASVVMVMAICLFLSGATVVPYARIQRDFLQGRQLVLDASTLLVGSGITIVLALHGWGAMSLAVGRVASQVLATGLQFRLAGVAPKFGWDRQIVPGILRFGVPVAGANLLSWVVIGVDNMVVGHVMGGLSLGFYVLAFNVSSWPMSAVGQVIRSVAFPAFSRLADEPARASEALRKACLVAWGLAVPLGALLVVLADPLVRGLYGSRWAPAAAPLAGLALFGALRVVFDVLAPMLFALGRSRLVLLVQVSWLAALIPAMVIGIHYRGLSGAAWAHLVTSATVALPLYLLALRGAGLAAGLVLRTAIVPVASGAVAAFLALGAVHLVEGVWTQLLVGTVTLGGSYTVVAGVCLLHNGTVAWDRVHARARTAFSRESTALGHSRDEPAAG